MFFSIDLFNRSYPGSMNIVVLLRSTEFPLFYQSFQGFIDSVSEINSPALHLLVSGGVSLRVLGSRLVYWSVVRSLRWRLNGRSLQSL